MFQTPALPVLILNMEAAGHQMSVFKSVFTLHFAQEDYSAMNLFIYYVSLMSMYSHELTFYCLVSLHHTHFLHYIFAK